MPDLGIVMPGGQIRFIEMKKENGRLSDAQRAVHAALTALGTPPVIARSIDDVRAALSAWGIATREANYDRRP